MYRAALVGTLRVRQARLCRRIRLGGCFRQGIREICCGNAPHRTLKLRNSSLRVWGTSNPFLFFGFLNQNDFLFTRSTSNGRPKVSFRVFRFDDRATRIRTWNLNDGEISVYALIGREVGLRTRPPTNPDMAVKRCFPSTHKRTLA